MFRNHLKIAIRSLRRNASTSLINMAGLSVGMCIALLIGLWIRDEWSYDKFHKNHQDIYQIVLNDKMGDGSINTIVAVPLPLIDLMRKSIPEVKYAAEQDWGWEHGLMVGDHRFSRRGLQASPDFLKIFTYPLLKGDPATALKESHSIVLTQDMADALFGDENPMGKMVRIDNREDLIVTGLMQNPPEQSNFDFDYIVPFSYFEFSAPWVRAARDHWTDFAFQGYVQLQPGATMEQVLPKIKNLVKEHLPQDQATSEVSLYPMDKWRLYSEFENGEAVSGFIKYVRIFGIIGTFVLIIACINFMNLATARTERRAKEVGVRKVVGSQRKHLVHQFLTESFLVSLISFGICLILAETTLPWFNQLTNKELAVPYAHLWFWGLVAGFIALTGLLAGSYPAFLLSGFSPKTILKGIGNARPGGGSVLPRKVLVVLQFSLSIGLIIGTLAVFLQLRYTMARPSGYDPDRLVMVNTTPDLARNFQVLKNELIASGNVRSVTRSGSPITSVFQHFPDVEWPGQQPGDKVSFANVSIGDDYFETTGMQMQLGRTFRSHSQADTASVIFNAAAIKRMALTDPVGKTVKIFGEPRTIVGVSEDVVMNSPFEPVEPTMFQLSLNWGDAIMFRLDPLVNVHEALGSIERIFLKNNPAYPFTYKFADEQYAKKFGREELTGKLVGFFGALAIFISCLGLFGLAMHMAERKTKEVGIRKVLGATLFSLWLSLTREFLLLVVFACLISIPVSAFLLQKWLEGYAYHTGLPWWVFGIASAAVIVLTLLTVSYQSIRAAFADPVKSLRSE